MDRRVFRIVAFECLYRQACRKLKTNLEWVTKSPVQTLVIGAKLLEKVECFETDSVKRVYTVSSGKKDQNIFWELGSNTSTIQPNVMMSLFAPECYFPSLLVASLPSYAKNYHHSAMLLQ